MAVTLQKNPKALVLKSSSDASVVTSVTVELEQLDGSARTTLQSKIKGEAVTELRKYLPSQLQASVLDAWRPTLKDNMLSLLIRVKENGMQDLMKQSGNHNLWVDAPYALRDGMRILWLKQGHGSERKVFDKTEALQYLTTLSEHSGLIVKDGVYGVRMSKELSDTQRAEFQLSPGDAYVIKGVPVAMTPEDLQDLLEQIGWGDVAVQPRTMISRGKVATWRARAVNDPPLWAAPVQIGKEDWFTIRIEKQQEKEKRIDGGHASFLGALLGVDKRAGTATTATTTTSTTTAAGQRSDKNEEQMEVEENLHMRGAKRNQESEGAEPHLQPPKRRGHGLSQISLPGERARALEEDKDSLSSEAPDWDLDPAQEMRELMNERLAQQQAETQSMMREMQQQVQTDMMRMMQEMRQLIVSTTAPLAVAPPGASVVEPAAAAVEPPPPPPAAPASGATETPSS